MKLVSVILPVFALVLIGWIGRVRQLLSPAAFQGLRDVVFFLAMPALLFSAIVNAPPFDLVAVTSVYFTASLSIFACGFAFARLLRCPLATAAMLGLNSAYGNTVMVGIPVIVAALGPEALPSLLAIVALHSAILLPLASALVEMDRGGRRSWTAMAGAVAAALRNPIIVSIFVAFLWRAAHLSLPDPVGELLRLLSAASTPLALICLGGSLPPLNARALDAEAGRLAHLQGLPLTVAILLGAMPTGANAFLLARHDERLAEVSAATVVVTTLLSPLTLSALLQLVA